MPAAVVRPTKTFALPARLHGWALPCALLWACNVAEPGIRDTTGGNGNGGAGTAIARNGGAGGGAGTGGAGGTGLSLPTLPDGGSAAGGGPGSSTGDDGGTSVAGKVLVYAHSATDLFQIDPASLAVKRVGRFFYRTENGGMTFIPNVTDIAIDKIGQMTGTTFSNDLLTINPETAESVRVAKLSSQLNGLSWIRTDDGAEVLAGAGLDGSVLRIDPKTGDATKIGSLGAGLKSSGDIVSVDKYGTLITLIGPSSGGDQLARIDPATGVATLIGTTKFQKIWGLGFWGNRVFGFTAIGEFILIDPKTGDATLVMKDAAFPFWGAAVSTSAPVNVD